jgi:hypothetical protein
VTIPTLPPTPTEDSLRRSDLGVMIIRTLIVANGIAAGGTLTFDASIFANGFPQAVFAQQIHDAIAFFGLGVVAAVWSAIAAYSAQLSFGFSVWRRRLALSLRVFAIVLGLWSALLFTRGVEWGAIGLDPVPAGIGSVVFALTGHAATEKTDCKGPSH